VGLLDLSDQFCWDDFCHATKDNFVIMRNRHHITASFAASLETVLEQRLFKEVAQTKSSP
jgi:hypothetical protein